MVEAVIIVVVKARLDVSEAGVWQQMLATLRMDDRLCITVSPITGT